MVCRQAFYVKLGGAPPMEWSGLFSWFEKLPPLSFAAAVVTGVLLLIGDTLITWLGLTEYRAWISFAFLVSVTVFLSQIVFAGWNYATRRIAEHRSAAAKNSRLENLPPGEVFVLARFLQKNSRSAMIDYTLYSVAALEVAEVISPTSNSCDGNDRPYVLAEWAWQWLRKNEHKLKPYPPVHPK
jgi:hypothetical protein